MQNNVADFYAPFCGYVSRWLGTESNNTDDANT
jgi:hypothetical protein